MSNNVFACGANRKLKRGDVVELPIPDCFLPGRVWRRIDDNHVQVIDGFKHISIYREDHLKLSDYKGRWDWQRHPGNDWGKTPKWIPMTSLRRLKHFASQYNPHFGRLHRFGCKRTRQDRLEALAEREVSHPGLVIENIVWDKEVNGIEQEVNLPEVVILRDISEEDVADHLSYRYNFYVKSFDIDRTRRFPGWR